MRATGLDGLCPSFALRTPDFVRLRRGGSSPYLFVFDTKNNRQPVGYLLFWCGRQDLNLHTVGHKNLNLACLPIPPRPHINLYIVFALLRCPKFSARCSHRKILTAAPSLPRFIVHRTHFGNDAANSITPAYLTGVIVSY